MKRRLVAASGALICLGSTVIGWSEREVTRPAEAHSSSASATAGVLTGEVLFRIKGCVQCHTGPDTDAPITGFPSLRDAGSFASLRRLGMSAEAYLAESIRNPAAFISPAFNGAVGPTEQMPALAISDAEVDALVEYLLHAP